MIHAGSLTIGHHSGLLNQKICQEIYPARLPHPENKIYPVPINDSMSNAGKRFWSASQNAANFGFANRLFLGFMIISGKNKYQERSITFIGKAPVVLVDGGRWKAHLLPIMGNQ